MHTNAVGIIWASQKENVLQITTREIQCSWSENKTRQYLIMLLCRKIDSQKEKKKSGSMDKQTQTEIIDRKRATQTDRMIKRAKCQMDTEEIQLQTDRLTYSQTDRQLEKVSSLVFVEMEREPIWMIKCMIDIRIIQ